MDNHMSVDELHKARENFFAERGPDTAVRDQISVSWQRSKAFNVQPDDVDLPYVRDPDLESPLAVAAAPVLHQLAEGLVDEPVSVILTSADGVVLSRVSGTRHLLGTLDKVKLAPGFSYLEEFAGTNGIGTALETRRPTLVSGPEHYVESLGNLMCAGVPIIHPISGSVAGVLDVTGWVEDGASLLHTLARSATAQIEGRLLSQSSEGQTALLNAYLRACRRSPQAGVIALGDDMVLLNRRLRLAVDPLDQAAVVEAAIDLSGTPLYNQQHVLTLPSGQTARMSHVRDTGPALREGMGVYLVHLSPLTSASAVPSQPSIESARALPGLVGSSASWRSSCSQISDCARQHVWVAVSGEPGSGRYSMLKAAAREHISARSLTIAAAELMTGDDGFQALESELEQDGFCVVIRDVDKLADAHQRTIADLLQGREHGGWVGVTISTSETSSTGDALVLPFFGHTVHVPALRHRIEDLEKLVPHLLRQLSRGQELELSSEAFRQLTKYTWPGNVAQLRDILKKVVRSQRSGVVEVSKLPPECRSVSRHALKPIEALQRDAIVRSLEDNRGNKQAAADALGISRATIYRKIREFGIDM